MASTEQLDVVRKRFAEWAPAVQNIAPLYARLSRRIADDDDVATALLANASLEQRIPVLLFAAVHDLVLEHPELDLAHWYGSVTAEPRTDDPYPAFAATVDTQRDRIEHTIATRTTQTNEVGRGAFYLPALARVSDDVGPISLIDVGASGGLNLNLDRYSYRYDDRPVDPADGSSRVELTCRTDGTLTPPTQMPSIVDRRGLDRTPVDLRHPADARWLRACVWPDQVERFARLDGAIGIAEAHPLHIATGDAVDDLAAMFDGIVGHPVVMNSWVLNYLSPDRRRDYVGVLDQIGAERDLSWVFAEAPVETPELPHASDERPELTHLNLARWRGGVRSVEHLALCHPHGTRLTWRAAVT